MNWTWYLFGFDGRINRAKMWLSLLIILCWMIFLGMLIFVVAIVFGGVKSFDFSVERRIPRARAGHLSLADVAGLATVFSRPSARRCSSWVHFAPPRSSGCMIATRADGGWCRSLSFPASTTNSRNGFPIPGSTLLLALIAFVLCIWGFVEMYCLKGSRKTNRFGPNPLPPPDTRPPWDQHREIEMVPHKAGPPPVWRVKPGA